MPSDTSPDREQLEQFVELSVELTGIESTTLWGTGMAGQYLDLVIVELGEETTSELLAYSGHMKALFDDNTLRSYARAVIKLWYLGQWCIGPQVPMHASFSVSPAAYSESLAWRVMGGHPQGARQQGYGSWSTPPIGEQGGEE